MNRDDVIRLARDAGLPFELLPEDYCSAVGIESGTVCSISNVTIDQIAAVVALAAAREREECAKLCEQSDRYRGSYFSEKIRARGQE